VNRSLKAREYYIKRVEATDPITYLWLTHEGSPLFRYTIAANEYIKKIEAFYLNTEANVASTYYDMDDYSYNMESRTYEDFAGNIVSINGYGVMEYEHGYPIVTDTDETGLVEGKWTIDGTLLEKLLETGDIDLRLPNKIVNPIGIHYDNFKYLELESKITTNDDPLVMEPDIALHLNVLASKGYWTWGSRNLLKEKAKITVMDDVGKRYTEVQEIIEKQELKIGESIITNDGKVIKLDASDLVVSTLIKLGYLRQ
jgi:hypothetical protein